MPKLHDLPAKDLVKALERLGFAAIRQKGSHLILKKTTDSGVIGCVVPMHDHLKLGTIRGILKQAKVSLNELMDVLD